MLITKKSFSIFNIQFYLNCADGFPLSKSENSIYQVVYPFYFNIYLLHIFKCNKPVDKHFSFVAADEKNERIFISSEDGYVYEFSFERRTHFSSSGLLKRILWYCVSSLKKQVVQTVLNRGKGMEGGKEQELEKRVQKKYDFLNPDTENRARRDKENSTNRSGREDEENRGIVNLQCASVVERDHNIYYDASKEFHIEYSLTKIMNINSMGYFSFSKNKILKLVVDRERSILYALSSSGTLYVRLLLSSKTKRSKHFLSETILYTKKELINQLKQITFFKEANSFGVSSNYDSGYYGEASGKKFIYPQNSHIHSEMNKIQLMDIQVCSVHERKNIFFTLFDTNFNVYYFSIVRSITNNAYKLVLKDFQNFPRKRGVRFGSHYPQVEYMKLSRDSYIVLKREKIFLEESERKREVEEEKQKKGKISNNKSTELKAPILTKEEFQKRKEMFIEKLNEDRRKQYLHKGNDNDEEKDMREEMERDIPYDEYMKQEKRIRGVRYKLIMITCSDENISSFTHVHRSNYSFEILNEYFIDEEIIAVLYKKRNYNFHNFYENSNTSYKKKSTNNENFFSKNYNRYSSGNKFFDTKDNLTRTHSSSVPAVSQRSASATSASTIGTNKNVGTMGSYGSKKSQTSIKGKRSFPSTRVYRREPSLSGKRSTPYELNRGDSSSVSFREGREKRSMERELKYGTGTTSVPSLAVKQTNTGFVGKSRGSSNSGVKRHNELNTILERDYAIDLIDNVPPFYLFDKTTSDYKELYDLMIVTRENIYYIVKNGKIEKIEKMINKYVTPQLHFDSRNIQQIIKEEHMMQQNIRENLEMFYGLAELAPFNKNERRIVNSLIQQKQVCDEQGIENEVIENALASLEYQCKAVFKYIISFLLEGHSAEEFLYIMWSLLFNYVYKHDVLILGNFLSSSASKQELPNYVSQWDLRDEYLDNTRVRNKSSERRISSVHRRGRSTPVHSFFYPAQKKGYRMTDTEEVRRDRNGEGNVDKKREKRRVRNHVESINYNTLNHIYKPSPFKLGFLDKTADYILKQGKLQREMEKEIKARNSKGINHLLHIGSSDWKMGMRGTYRGKGELSDEREEHENIDEEEEEYRLNENKRIEKYVRLMNKGKKEKSGIATEGQYDSFYSNVDERKLYGFDPLKKQSVQDMIHSLKNKSGNFAYEYLSEQNFNVFFLQNFNVPRNNTLHTLSKGLLLFLSRLLKPILFIRLFRSEKYMSNNVYRFPEEYGLHPRKQSKTYTRGVNRDTKISLLAEGIDSGEHCSREKFFDMKQECIVRLEPESMMPGRRKRKRDVFEKSEEEILIGNVPLDCCLNLIEKLKCLSVCVSLIIKSASKKQNKYKKEDGINRNEAELLENGMGQDDSYKSVYNEFSLMIMNEIEELSSILNFIHFSIEYLLVYSILISDAYKMKNCIRRKEKEQNRLALHVGTDSNHVYLSSHLFDMLLKCSFLKAYLSRTYRIVLKQCIFSVMKTEKYVPIDFFQGYIIHKVEFLALFLTKQIERTIIANEEEKKMGKEYLNTDKEAEREKEKQWRNPMKLSEKRAEHYITHNLREVFNTSTIYIHKLLILLYKVGYYQCVSVLVKQSMNYFYKSLRYGSGIVDPFIEKSEVYPHAYISYESYSTYSKSGKQKKITGLSQVVDNMDYFYQPEFFRVYNSCFLPIERIVYINYIKYVYSKEAEKKQKKKEKIRKFLSTMLITFIDINFHFFIFHLILYKCKNEFPCRIFEFSATSPFFYYFIKLNELNIPKVYMYYFKQKKYQDVVIYFAKKANRKWKIEYCQKGDETSLVQLYSVWRKKIEEAKYARSVSAQKTKCVRFVNEVDSGIDKGKIKEIPRVRNRDTGMGRGKSYGVEMGMGRKVSRIGEKRMKGGVLKERNNPLGQLANFSHDMFFLDFFTIDKMETEVGLHETVKLIEENCFSFSSVVERNSLYNSETEEIFENICMYMDRIREDPSLTNRMEFTRKCINAKIFIIEQTCLFKTMKQRGIGRDGNRNIIGDVSQMERVLDSGKEKGLSYEESSSTFTGLKNPFLRNSRKQTGMDTTEEEKPLPRGYYENILNENRDLNDTKIQHYCIADRSIEYDKKFSENLKLIFENNNCLFQLKKKVFEIDEMHFSSLEDLLRQRNNILNQKKMLAEILNLFVYYVYIYCTWDKIRNYFSYLIFGTKKQKWQVISFCEKLNREEELVSRDAISRMRSYMASAAQAATSKSVHKGLQKMFGKGSSQKDPSGTVRVVKDFKEGMRRKMRKVNILLMLKIVDTFMELIKITQHSIHSEESLKSEIHSRSLAFCKEFLPSIYLLKLFLLCGKKKEAIDELNENCISTVNHLIYIEKKRRASMFNKYSSFFEKLLDFSFAVSLNFKRIDFVVNYSGDLIKLHEEKFGNCLYLMMIIKLHRFINNLLKIDHVKKTLKINELKKKKIYEQRDNKKVNLKTFLKYIPHIYLDNALNVLMIAESDEGDGKSIFSKISPFTAADAHVNPDITKMYDYHNLKTSLDEKKGKDDKGGKGSQKKSSQKFTYEEEFDQEDQETYYGTEEERSEPSNYDGEEDVEVDSAGYVNDVKNVHVNFSGNEKEVGKDSSGNLKSTFKVLSPEDTKSLNHLHQINKSIFEDGDTKNKGVKQSNVINEFILLSHNNYCFYLVWVTKLLINHRVEYKSLIESYIKIYNILKYQKYAQLPRHEIVLIIYFIFTLWINGTVNEHSFFYHNLEKSYREKGKNVRFYLKNKYGKEEILSNYSLLMLLKELASRSEFFIHYAADANIREHDISTIILNPQMYHTYHVKKETILFIIDFFTDIYKTFKDALRNIDILNYIKQFQAMGNFLENFKNFLSKIYEIVLMES